MYNYSGNNPIMYNDPIGNSYAAPGHSREQFAKDFPFGEYEANSFDESSGGAAGYNSNGFQSLDAFLNEVNHLYDGFNYSNPNTIPGSITLYKAGVNDVSVIQNLFNLFKNGGEIEFNNGYWKSTYNNSYTDASGTALVGSSGILDYGKYKVNANQGGDCCKAPTESGYDLNPNSVGHNYFSSVYIGPNNPVSYNGLKYYYNITPKNRADAGARSHDLGYDAVHAKGVAGVFFDTDALPADFKLIGNEFSLGANPFNGATYTERGQGFLISIGIGIAIIPKAIVYGLSAVKN